MWIFLEKILNKKKKNDFIKVTNNGSLYIETSDFIKQEKFKKTVHDLLKSELIKDINDKRQMQHQ